MLRLADGAESSRADGILGQIYCLFEYGRMRDGLCLCATGQMVFLGILPQARSWRRLIMLSADSASHGERLRNIVMMGMGEPLHNFEPVMEALGIITDNRGLNIGPARVAISGGSYPRYFETGASSQTLLARGQFTWRE